MLNLVVSSPTDRISRGGGSVVVSSAGAITLTPASGQIVTATTAIASGVNPAQSGQFRMPNNAALTARNVGNTADIELIQGHSAGTIRIGQNGYANEFISTSTHTFSGPVSATSASAAPFVANLTAAAGSSQRIFDAQRGGATRHNLLMEATTQDLVFRASTDGSAFTEALRIVNANGYVSVPTRLGVGTASPSYPLQIATAVIGIALHTADGGVYANQIASTAQAAITGAVTNAGGKAGHFQQYAASATAPVMTVKLGATPGAGGDALQIQNSSGSVLTFFDSTGALNSSVINMVGAQFTNTRLSITTGNTVVVGAAIRGAAGQTADLFQAQASDGIAGMVINAGRYLKWANAGFEQTTVGAAGGASALPATPTKFLKVVDSAGTALVIPAYAAA